MKHKLFLGGMMVAGLMGWGVCQTMAQSNLCSNGSFTSQKDPFEGWTINYEFSGSSVYANNHKAISFLPAYMGRKNVARMEYISEKKMETPLIPFEQGSRYQCTLDVAGDVGIRVHFNGYNWRPGVEPTDKPQLKDMRQNYRGDAFDGKASSWRTITVEIPHAKISSLAQSHLKKVRFLTVEILIPEQGPSGKAVYVSNVKVTKIGKYTVSKAPGE